MSDLGIALFLFRYLELQKGKTHVNGVDAILLNVVKIVGTPNNPLQFLSL